MIGTASPLLFVIFAVPDGGAGQEARYFGTKLEVPPTAAGAAGGVPVASEAKYIVTALSIVRKSAIILEPRATAVASMNLGTAIPPRMPKIAITTTSSTSVKPFLSLKNFINENLPFRCMAYSQDLTPCFYAYISMIASFMAKTSIDGEFLPKSCDFYRKRVRHCRPW